MTAVDVTGTENVQFSYGPDRSRWIQNYDSGTEITYYIGGLMEEVETNITDYRHYVYAGSEPVAILSRKNTGVNTWSYLLSDHIGSTAAITSSTGTVDINESFTSFGARRNPTTWSGAPASGDLTTIAGLSREGFTFQTALGQSMGLNHMNGRIQDAITGRFLSADPNIPDPTSAQSYNRFSYVSNNPLTEIDPTGFVNHYYPACAGCGGYQGTYGTNATFDSGLIITNMNGNSGFLSTPSGPSGGPSVGGGVPQAPVPGDDGTSCNAPAGYDPGAGDSQPVSSSPSANSGGDGGDADDIPNSGLIYGAGVDTALVPRSPPIAGAGTLGAEAPLAAAAPVALVGAGASLELAPAGMVYSLLALGTNTQALLYDAIETEGPVATIVTPLEQEASAFVESDGLEAAGDYLLARVEGVSQVTQLPQSVAALSPPVAPYAPSFCLSVCGYITR